MKIFEIGLYIEKYRKIGKEQLYTEGHLNTCTVEPPITDPPTGGQPLYNGHWLWHGLKILYN